MPPHRIINSRPPPHPPHTHIQVQVSLRICTAVTLQKAFSSLRSRAVEDCLLGGDDKGVGRGDVVKAEIPVNEVMRLLLSLSVSASRELARGGPVLHRWGPMSARCNGDVCLLWRCRTAGVRGLKEALM
jgi:hypothetical protein